MRKVEALVHSPEQRAHVRKGRGFSLNELKEAGLTLHDAKMFKIPVDKRRRGSHLENVETLKKNYKKTTPKPKPEKPKKTIIKKPKKTTKKTTKKPRQGTSKKKVKHANARGVDK